MPFGSGIITSSAYIDLSGVTEVPSPKPASAVCGVEKFDGILLIDVTINFLPLGILAADRNIAIPEDHHSTPNPLTRIPVA